MSELIGNMLGRYQITALQGHGGMSQVYKAWDPNTQRNVAIKVLHAHLADEDGFRERFTREGALVASLNHTNIVSLYDFDMARWEGKMLHYMVMPFVDGPSLRDRIETAVLAEETIPLTEVVNVVEGIAAALDYAHGREMAHRDIKPANILFDEHNKPLLTDFGLARLTSGKRLTQTAQSIGTPAYMSPEQGMGEAGDHRSDIYSLGIVLYEMLTGQLPFEADTGFALIMKHITEPLPALTEANPELSNSIEAVVYRATAKEPDSRYQRAGELAHELRSAVFGEQVSHITLAAVRKQQEETATVWQTVAKPAQKIGGQRSLLLLGLLSLLAVLVLGFGVLQAGSQVPEATALPTTDALSSGAESMAGGPIPFSSSFDPGDEYNAGWPVSGGLLTRAIEDSVYRMRSEIRDQAHTAIYDPSFQYSSLLMQVDATLQEPSQPESGYGLIFRYVNENNFYVFAVNGRQQVSIWVLHQGQWQELRGGVDAWTFDGAVNPLGQTNHLSLLAEGDTFWGFVNGEEVVEVQDSRLDAGAVGFYMATTQRTVDGVLSEVLFDDFSVTNAVQSMTDDSQ